MEALYVMVLQLLGVLILKQNLSLVWLLQVVKLERMRCLLKFIDEDDILKKF
jgi:hypothetical protein